MQNVWRTAKIMAYVKDSPDIDPTHILAALGGSEKLYEEMFVQMICLIPSCIKQMDAYIETEDVKAFGIVAHGLKGSLRQAGCERLANLAGALESAAKDENLPDCREQYVPFKDLLCSFYEQADAVIKCAFLEAEADTKPCAAINDYTDALSKTKSAIEGYDSLLASELLAPLTEQSFGERIDTQIALVMDALHLYKPEAALNHMNELLAAIKEA